MIVSLQLKKFRQHTDLLVDFTPGLNAIRGPNESGKSTLIEAVLYAMFGAKALRESLKDTVTWGGKESELWVKAVMKFEGTTYTFTRSKAGAECHFGDLKITGQSEVTAKSADLLGADAKMASMLMMASQSDLRGALADGPTAVSGLMSKLADFDTIDRILEAATQRLTLGSSEPLLTKLAGAQELLRDAQTEVAQEDNSAELAQQVTTLQAQYDEGESAAQALQDAMLAADHKVQEAKESQLEKRSAAAVVADTQSRILIEQTKLQAAQTDAVVPNNDERVAQLRSQIHEASGRQRLINAYDAWKALPPYPDDFWEGTKAAFDSDMAVTQAQVNTWAGRRQEIAAEIKAERKSMITSGKCPTCGHEATSDEHVAEHNDKVLGRIAALEVEASGLAVKETPLNADLAAFARIAKKARVFEDAVLTLGDTVKVDGSVFPPKLMWSSEVPVVVDTRPLQRELNQIQAAENAAAQAQGRAAAHTHTVDQLRRSLELAVAKHAGIVEQDLEPLQAAYNAAYHSYATRAETNFGVKSQITDLSNILVSLKAQRRVAEITLVQTQELIKSISAELVSLDRNNSVVSKVKKLKPMISDHLWNSVLAAVSNFFSAQRGEESVVTKDADGFKVNGKPIGGLSGSTQDVLAIAIRVALTKTFIPHASFVVLDEPAHGCDDARTNNVLGFLAAAGFEQTILASHDKSSESVADNVINLGDD